MIYIFTQPEGCLQGELEARRWITVMYTWHKWAMWVRNTCRPSIHNWTGLEHLQAGLGVAVQWAGGRNRISERGGGAHRWASCTKSCHGDWWEVGRREQHKQSSVCRSNPSPVMLANSNSYMTSGEEKKPQDGTLSQPFLPFTKRGYTQTKVIWYLSIVSFFPDIVLKMSLFVY